VVFELSIFLFSLQYYSITLSLTLLVYSILNFGDAITAAFTHPVSRLGEPLQLLPIPMRLMFDEAARADSLSSFGGNARTGQSHAQQ
jgi:hypothetical protein